MFFIYSNLHGAIHYNYIHTSIDILHAVQEVDVQPRRGGVLRDYRGQDSPQKDRPHEGN